MSSLKQILLVAVMILDGCDSPATEASAPDGGLKLTQAERAIITQHFGEHWLDHINVNRSINGTHSIDVTRSTEFPEVLQVTNGINDAGWQPRAMIVDGAWLDWNPAPAVMMMDGRWIDWSPAEATRRVLQARGWSTLDDDGRKKLALRWIIDSFPPNLSSQTAADGGHPPEVSIEDGHVIVRVWLIRRSTSIGGRSVSRYPYATMFRFKPDGSMIEARPAPQQPSH